MMVLHVVDQVSCILGRCPRPGVNGLVDMATAAWIRMLRPNMNDSSQRLDYQSSRLDQSLLRTKYLGSRLRPTGVRCRDVVNSG